MSGFQKDEWLSTQLGRACYRCEADGAAALDAELKSSGNTGAFAYSRVPCEKTTDAVTLQKAGFHVVDVNLGFSKPLEKHVPSAHVREATAEDEELVAEIAATSYRFSRFHLDPAFDLSEAQALKGAWVRNFFRGQRGDRLFLASTAGVVSGFLLALKTADSCVIDLIAVCENARRKGLAAAMIAACENAFPDVARITAGTQAANIPSVRLYESLGFRLSSSQYLLHRHS